MNFTWEIPSLDGASEPTRLSVENGTVIFVVGPNGCGKSALVTQLSKGANAPNMVRIAAHRQSWLPSSSVDLTQKSRKDIQKQINQRDRQDDSRWKDDYAQPRTQAALFDLANAQNRMAREVHDLLKKGNKEEAIQKSKLPSPLEAMNDILAVSALAVRLSISDDGDVLASHAGSPSFSISQLSDGERNAVMLAAQVLTAKPDTLFIVDEPERHLHRSITEPMLSALFEKRKDCAFVIATHEPELPTCNSEATVLIVRQCNWTGATASGWDIDQLAPGLEVPDETRRAILGSRRSIIFVEGEPQSLDYPLVSALFPGVSVVPRGNCRDVERSVVGLAGTEGLHWLQPFGLIDRDDRTNDEVADLAARNVFALEVSSIESIFYSKAAINAIAAVQGEIFELDKDELAATATRDALRVLEVEQRRNLAARRSEKSARNKLLSNLPDWKTIKENEGADIQVIVPTIYADEIQKIEGFIADARLEDLIFRYAIKKTNVPGAIAQALRFSHKRHYEEAVVTLAKKEEVFRDALRSYVDPLHVALSADEEADAQEQAEAATDDTPS